MNRFATLLFALLASSITLRAQVKIGDNLKTVNANSILELESTTKALLLPRLTNTQIQAMQNVPAGMLVYSSTDNVLMLRTNSGWTTLASAANAASASGPWSVSSNVTYTNNNVGIGTNQPFSQLANNSGNTSGSDGQGGNAGSISWAASQPGYVGQFYNGGKEAANNGIVVKVNSTAATALDVSQGSQTGNATPLLTVKSNGNVGIGQSNPSFPLDVNGQISASTFNLGVQYVFFDASVPGSDYAYIPVGCPSGTQLIGGGAGHRDLNSAAIDITVNYSGPDPSNPSTVWRAIVHNTTGGTFSSGSARAVRVYAICANVK